MFRILQLHKMGELMMITFLADVADKMGGVWRLWNKNDVPLFTLPQSTRRWQHSTARHDNCQLRIHLSCERMAPVFVLFHVFVSYVLLATNVGVLATAPKEKKVDDMAETRERGFATARKFRAGGCCQICETKFYRELAFLEVSEDHKLETVSRFHTWNSLVRQLITFTNLCCTRNFSATTSLQKRLADCKVHF